jgi:hypothetical protein
MATLWRGILPRVTAGERIETALELFDLAIDLLRTRLRREQPDLRDEEIEEALRIWMLRRPGAEHGDSVGRLREP